MNADSNLVLVIEDDIEISNILVEVISSLGFPAYCCFNGREALDALSEKNLKPVLVLCDINMPEMSGIEFIRHQTAKNMGLNICILSSDHSPETLVQALQLGVLDYISKPPRIADLKEKILRFVDYGKRRSAPSRDENFFRIINSLKK